MPACLDGCFLLPNVFRRSQEIPYLSCIDTMEQESPDDNISVHFTHEMAPYCNFAMRIE
jgi:hypothetical protein